MKVSNEFLVIENGRAVIKTLEKTIDNPDAASKRTFIKECLERDDVVFCKDYRPKGWHNTKFKSYDLTLKHRSNYGFGFSSYSYLEITYGEMTKIASVSRGVHHNIEIEFRNQYSIEIAQDIFNEYIVDPDLFKKDVIKNNIKHLKRALKMETEAIAQIKEIIVPEVESKIKELSIKIEPEELLKNYDYQQLDLELRRFTNADPGCIEWDSNHATSILKRKLRVDLIKIEINNLIDLFKEEEDLMVRV